ncbi:hypothetical protein [Marinifilum caeruleilacunae]|uniref:Lipoprotein n=1 Tax=Marinifilum caeruleilacunae TaxID=2499076 RepID=A0ABX1WXY5_9BACT|nr:hypothetical protein [Marinifilum caeruleilacunae]NOU60939.1 hypothetical protein [Marinifilum caeruleilacunae]
MEKLKTLAIAILLSGFLFVGCSKEENDHHSSNYLKLGGSKYDLQQGVLENFGSKGNSSNKFNLTLLSAGFTIHEFDEVFDSISGTGHGVYFVLYSSSSEKLEIGDYVYDSYASGESKSYDYADGVINYNTQTEEGSYLEITNGTLSILQNSETYEISFNGTDDDISFYYKGSLNDYDYSEHVSESTAYPKSITLKAELRIQ